jgi:hypothetical protein
MNGRIAIFIWFCGVVATTPAAELLHHYNFMQNCSDAVGGAEGTLMNGASVSQRTLLLDGEDDFVDFKQHLIPTTNSFSLAMFAFQISPQPGFVELISQGESQSEAVFLGHNSKGTMRVGGNWMETAVRFPKSGKWHHYAVTVNRTAGVKALFIDGQLMSTKTNRIGGPLGNSTNQATRLGRQFEPWGEFFRGRLADVRIYRGALTAPEVAKLASMRAALPAVAEAVISTKPTMLLPANDLISFYVFVKDRGLNNDPKRVFSLADGLMRISGEEQGYIATKLVYSNYRLLAEYKWGSLSTGQAQRDSGVFIHGHGPDKYFMSSIECNLLAGGQQVSGEVVLIGPQCRLTVNGEVKAGGGVSSVERQNHEKPIGEWNTMEILSENGRFQVKVNGQVVTEGTDLAPKSGKILLQSRWGEIFFRRLELHPAKASASN